LKGLTGIIHITISTKQRKTFCRLVTQ